MTRVSFFKHIPETVLVMGIRTKRQDVAKVAKC